MGRVWRAVDLRLEREVALKVLKASDEGRRLALIQEAKTACQLNHPNIATVFDAGEVEGQPYMAMELVEGRDLRSLAGTLLPEAQISEILAQAAGALHHAHARGIVHRDIKPENLLVNGDGALKILDFGVAKRGMLANASDTSSGFTRTEETGLGVAVGTPAYMSPEQAYGLSLTAATDQFSLAVVLFEVATGTHPFRRESMLDTLQAIAKEAPPELRTLRPDLSLRFSMILNRMLAKKPEDRFPEIKNVVEALQGEGAFHSTGRISALPASAPPPASGRPRRRWIPWAVGVGATILLGAAFLPFLLRVSGHARLGHGRPVVAVLPLEMFGIPQDKSWVGPSIQDAMATGLLRRGDLLVLDRLRVAEALALPGVGPGDLAKLVRELGADFLVLSALRASEGHSRLTVRIIRGTGGEVVNQLSLEGQPEASLAMEEMLGERLPPLFGPTPGQAQSLALPKARLPRTREMYARSLELMDRGNLTAQKEAYALLAEAAREEPDYSPVRAGMAWALLEMAGTETHLGRPEAREHTALAVAEARKAVALDARVATAHRVLGQALLRLGDMDEARAASQQAVDLDPGDYRAWTSLGDSCAYRDEVARRQEARKHYLRALELHPRDWWAHFRLSTLLQNDGELEEAVLHADRSRELQPTADYSHLTAGVCLLWLGDYEGAQRRLADGAAQVPDSGLIRVTLGLLDFSRGRPQEFLARHQSLAGRWPEDHPVAVLLAGLQEGASGRTGAMAERFRSYAERLGRTDRQALSIGERRSASVNCYHMARVLCQAGRTGEARVLLAAAERLHPGKLQVAARDAVLRKLP